MNQETTKKEIAKVASVLRQLPTFDDGSFTFEFKLHSYANDTLRIIGGRDLSLKYHEVEILFEQVHWIDLPVDWKIEKASEAVRLSDPAMNDDQIKFKSVYEGYSLFELPNDLTGSSGWVASTGVNVITGICYHYERPDLQEGQRIATWATGT